MKNVEELRKEAIEMLGNDDELLIDMVNELDSQNGYADGFRAYEMYMIDDIFCDCKVSEFLDKLAPGFNLNDEYFVDTIYGINSTNDIASLYRDNVWSDELLDNIIANKDNIYFNDSDFEALIDKIEAYENLETLAVTIEKLSPFAVPSNEEDEGKQAEYYEALEEYQKIRSELEAY